jgi:hypothetical protein
MARLDAVMLKAARIPQTSLLHNAPDHYDVAMGKLFEITRSAVE